MNNFGFVRLLAACLVIVGHSFDLTGHVPPMWFDTGVEGFAVRVFFVISGYLICASWNSDPSPHRYLWRRALRIFPGLAAVVVLSACVLGPAFTTLPLSEYFSDRYFRLYFWNIALAPFFGLPGVFQGNGLFTAVNGSLWTLPAEFLMYLLVPVYGTASLALCRRVVLPVVLAASLAVAFYYNHVAPAAGEPVFYWTSVPFVLRWAPYFVAGAAVRVWRLEPWLNLQAALLLIGALPCMASFSPAVYQAGLLLFTPYIVLAACLAPQPRFAAVGRRTDLSYGVYLYGFPVQQAFIALFGPPVSPVLLTAFAVPMSLLCAYASWHLVERPALQWKPAAVPRPVPSPA